jgi:hypothetical protein
MCEFLQQQSYRGISSYVHGSLRRVTADQLYMGDLPIIRSKNHAKLRHKGDEVHIMGQTGSGTCSITKARTATPSVGASRVSNCCGPPHRTTTIERSHMVARQIWPVPWPVPQLCAARRATAHFRSNCHQTVQRAARRIVALASQSVHPASDEVSI